MPDGPALPSRPPWVAIGLLSGVGLGYEILLTRLLSLVHWHHLVPVVISLALLGYGASGTLLSLFRPVMLRRFGLVFTSAATLFALTAPLAFVAVRSVPFNPEAIPWAPGQLAWLLAIFLLLAMPFFCLATSIGLALTAFAARAHSVYAVDLLGAGAGAVSATLALYWAHPDQILFAVGLLGLVGTLIGLLEIGCLNPARLLPLVASVFLLWGAHAAGLLHSPPAEYKDLHRALLSPGSQIEAQLVGPMGVITAVRSDRVPMRYAPGLSLRAGSGPPEQRGLFIDGDSAGAITRFDGIHPPQYLADLSSMLPYQLLPRARVLVLEPGGGTAVLQALAGGAVTVDVVEPNATLSGLIRGPYGAFSGALYDLPAVRLQLEDARRFLDLSDASFDLVVVDLVDTQDASATGLAAQRVSYLYTREAFRSMLDRLEPGGLLSITRWLQLPPRDILRLVATAIMALEDRGVRDPGRHLAVIRGWNTTVMLASPSPLSDQTVQRIRSFAQSRSFDLVYHPGLSPEDVNRFNRLETPLLHEGVAALLSGARDDFIEAYPFSIAPVTDDRPFFFRYSRWRNLGELLSLPGGIGYGQIDWGYWVLVAAALQALVLGLVMILWPLRCLPSGPAVPQNRIVVRWLSYFALIGMGYLFVEVAYLQHMQRFLGHPVHAVAAVLGGFLSFSGLGSAVAARLPGSRRALVGALGSVAGLAVVTLMMLPPLMGWVSGLSMPLRFGFAVVVIAPVAFAMGMPFPLALRMLAARAPPLLPLAWGVNGCASVVSAVTAALLAMAVGFRGVVLCAACLYLLAGAMLVSRSPASPNGSSAG